MTELIQELQFDKERLNSFFIRFAKRKLRPIVLAYRKAFIIGIILLGISFVLFSSMSARHHFVPFNFFSGMVGIFYIAKGVIKLIKHKKLKCLSKNEIAKYFERNQHVKTATYKVDELKLDYYENGVLTESFPWAELTDIAVDEESFIMIFDGLSRNLFIVESEVEPTFYRDLLELAKEKQKVKTQ
jgi:hypothetical protein